MLSVGATIQTTILADKLFVYRELELFGMREERIRALVKYLSPAVVAKKTGLDRRRWGTVAHNLKVKVRIEDMDALLDAFPEYELWVWKGEVDPAKGQISPAYAVADLKLEGQNAGSR